MQSSFLPVLDVATCIRTGLSFLSAHQTTNIHYDAWDPSRDYLCDNACCHAGTKAQPWAEQRKSNHCYPLALLRRFPALWLQLKLSQRASELYTIQLYHCNVEGALETVYNGGRSPIWLAASLSLCTSAAMIARMIMLISLAVHLWAPQLHQHNSLLLVLSMHRAALLLQDAVKWLPVRSRLSKRF